MYIIMNGFSKSGKTTLVNKLKEKFPKTFVNVDTTNIHNFLNTTYDVFQDDNTINGIRYNLRDTATQIIQNNLQELFLREKINLIDDSCNSTKEKRQALIAKAKSIDPETKIMIISVEVDENTLLKRLKDLDDELASKGKERAWIDLYEKIQKPKFEKPTADEADVVLFYNSKNETEIFSEITKLLNS